MDDQSDAGESIGDSEEAVFRMDDPQAAVISLARLVVNGQQVVRTMRVAAETAKAAQGLVPEHVQRIVERSRDFERDWINDKLPMLIVSIRLALEVLDTFGPEGVAVDDPIEAAIWNNKQHVWLNEIRRQQKT